jgi:hypothetical protein
MSSRIHQGFQRTIKNTGKVVPMHAVKAQRGMEVTAPLTLYLGPGLRIGRFMQRKKTKTLRYACKQSH